MIAERKNERYVLMISKVFYGTYKKQVEKFIYSDNLLSLFEEQDNWKKQKISNIIYRYEYEFFDYYCCRYIKRNELIGFVDNTPITCVVRWGKNGRKYEWFNISEKEMKRLIEKYHIDQVCEHTLWLES